jgi:hypothetical protein
VAPSRFDLKGWRDSRRGELQAVVTDAAPHLIDRLPAGANPDGFRVELRDIPARTVAYIRSSLTRLTNCPSVSPTTDRNTRWKWNGEKHAARATSASRSGRSRLRTTWSIARLTRST